MSTDKPVLWESEGKISVGAKIGDAASLIKAGCDMKTLNQKSTHHNHFVSGRMHQILQGKLEGVCTAG